jgi:hypothetical protein
MAQKEIDRINARGFARGWHATMLKRESTQTGRTMAALHLERVANVSAFNVPAEATAIKGGKVHYRFIDGSECSHPYVKRA